MLLKASERFPSNRKPAKKAEMGSICMVGNRMAGKRLKGGRVTTYNTKKVQRKCHIAIVIWQFASWVSVKILWDINAPPCWENKRVRLAYILFMKTMVTVERVFNRMNCALTILDLVDVSVGGLSGLVHRGSFSMSSF
jgi:hypothetical protein